MYDLIDRPVASLAPNDRFLLDAMRAWVHALTVAGAPDRAVLNGFEDHGGAEGSDAFDAAMRMLDRESIETLTFQRPCHAIVGEDEAIVIGLWRQVDHDRLSDARHTATFLVGGAAQPMIGTIARACAALDLD